MTRISHDYSKIPEHYREDVKTIVESCFRRGLVVTPEEAYAALNFIIFNHNFPKQLKEF